MITRAAMLREDQGQDFQTVHLNGVNYRVYPSGNVAAVFHRRVGKAQENREIIRYLKKYGVTAMLARATAKAQAKETTE